MEIIKLENELCDFPNEFPNSIYNSRFSQCIPYKYNSGSTISIKYVLKGKEHYIVNGKQHSVAPNKYLIVGTDRDVESFCDVKSGLTEAFSIFLEKDYVRQVYHSLTTKDDFLLDNPFETGDEIEMHENIYNINDNQLGRELLKLGHSRQDQENGQVNDTYYDLVNQLIRSQEKVKLQIENIRALKKSTKKELYRRLLNAKLIIEDFQGRVDIPFLSREVGLSQFHFLRSFRQAFGTTPYRFAIQVRMHHAMRYLRESDHSVLKISTLLDFNDIHCFSKAFKKETGLTPTMYRTIKKAINVHTSMYY